MSGQPLLKPVASCGREVLSKLSVHVEMASRINREMDERSLVDLGKLEQDLVYGEATSKEVINFLSAHPAVPAFDKVNLPVVVFLIFPWWYTSITSKVARTCSLTHKWLFNSGSKAVLAKIFNIVTSRNGMARLIEVTGTECL